MSELRWGIDLGGTKIEATVLHGEEPLCRHRIATEADQGYQHIIARIGLVLDEVAAMVGQRPGRLGIGTPGTHDPQTQKMRGCNTVVLNGQPLPADLERALGIPVRIANDANCFALAEAVMGAGRGLGVVFGVIMGTGVGGGIVVDGRVLNGLQGIAGEWGHNELVANGEPCYCGRRGCVETYLSGPALERRYESLSGKKRKLPEIVDLARGLEDPAASTTLRNLFEMFGRAIGPIVNVLDPDAIVLGGGVGNIRELLTEGAEEAKRFIFNPSPKVELVAPELGDSAGVFGAALLWNDQG
ncbi:MAG: ROK family protein [Fimbriimonadaceae bacterium]|nr:ROK family protein [Fimbriimonadaceae bacterium]